MRRVRRIWSETVGYDVLASARVLDLLRRFDLSLLVAVRPWNVAKLGELSRACLGAGVPLALWPMLADEDGRWANVQNANTFATLVRDALGASEAALRAEPEVAVDLEPSFDALRGVSAIPPRIRPLLRARALAKRSRAGDPITLLAHELAARGARGSATIIPLVLLDDDEDGERGVRTPWQEILGTPLDRRAWSRVNVMLYTSLLEGWSRGLLERQHALDLLDAASRATSRRFGDMASLSLGAVGVGAFGNEPVYRTPQELAEDVSVANRAGIDDLTLLDLGGVLARGPAERWLEVFCGTPSSAVGPVSPARSLTFRARAALFALGGATRTLGTVIGRSR